MIRPYHIWKSDWSRHVCLIAVSLVGTMAAAQQATRTAPLAVDEVIQRVVQMNNMRAIALEGYSSLRAYHLECHCLSPKSADMIVRVEYQAPDTTELTIVSESGSGTIRDHVFRKMLKAEQESMQLENQQQSAITPENYAFRLSTYIKSDTDEFYVLEAQPRNKNKFQFRGRIWVDARDFAVTRLEGEPAVSPSWWTEKTEFAWRFQKVGDFWLPVSNESETRVRIYGTALLTIEYRDYQIRQTRAGTHADLTAEDLSRPTAASPGIKAQSVVANGILLGKEPK